jgi:nucleotide-binding universal stress UspA family protein
MLPIKTILHPTDFSERSKYAFRLACVLARSTGARIVVLHVSEPPLDTLIQAAVSGVAEETIVSARMHLASFEARGIKMEHRMVEGDPASAIVQAATATNCDMIVMGTHGRSGLNRLLMGSVAEAVVRHALCPVLTVKTPLAEAPALEPVAALAAAPP